MGRGWYCLHRRALWRVSWRQLDSGRWHGKGFVSIPLEKRIPRMDLVWNYNKPYQPPKGQGVLPDNITGIQGCCWHKTTTGQSRQTISKQLTQPVFFL